MAVHKIRKHFGMGSGKKIRLTLEVLGHTTSTPSNRCIIPTFNSATRYVPHPGENPEKPPPKMPKVRMTMELKATQDPKISKGKLTHGTENYTITQKEGDIHQGKDKRLFLRSPSVYTEFEVIRAEEVN